VFTKPNAKEHYGGMLSALLALYSFSVFLDLGE
jgi:hypothetical protein